MTDYQRLSFSEFSALLGNIKREERMVQWVNFPGKNSFVNLMRLSLWYEKTRANLPSVTGLYGRQDKILVNL